MPIEEKTIDEMGVEGKEMPTGLESLKSEKLYDKFVDIASNQLAASSSYKQPRMAQWKKFDDAYNLVVKKKLRQMFSVPLPIYPGFLDTLASDYDEPIEIQFTKKHPADHFKAKKAQASWDMDKASMEKTARWDYKVRIDKKFNIRYGRSVLKSFAESDPKYRFVVENTDPYYFHCQPMGGGILENHLFCGEENVFKSEADLDKGVEEGFYDAKQWELLKARANSREYMDQLGSDYSDKMARFSSLGLDPDKDNYVGEKRYNLVEWCFTYKGKRWYILFDAWTKTWLRCCLLKEIYSKNLWPWTSWASHEDNRVFWSIGYGDVFYPVAESAVQLFNQELGSREKTFNNTRLYDKDLVTNVAELDGAQYRSGALVSIDTKGGTRDLQKAVFSLPAENISGTIELIDWVKQSTGKDTGVTDISQGSAIDASKKVNVAFLEQASISKRIGYKSQSYTECIGEAFGLRYIQGLKDHLGASEKKWIEVLGEDGLEPDVLTREDLYTKGDIGVKVISSTAQKNESQAKRKGRVEAITALKDSQNLNSEWRDAAILRDIGGYSESEIREALDTKSYGSRDSMAKAHIVIQEILVGASPALNFAADVAFLQTIHTYMVEHRNKLGPKLFMKFATYLKANTPFAQDNEVNDAKTRGQQNARRAALAQGMAGKGAPAGGGQSRGPVQQPSPEKIQQQ